jgi:hypothetical protein
MTTTAPGSTRPVSPWASGLALFAGTMMIIIGAFHAIMGLTALFNDEFYLLVPNYTFKLDVTGWGWIHLILGVLIAIAGYAVMVGNLWARVVGIILAAGIAIANFFFTPYYPFWSILIIVLCVAVIWALSKYEGEI